MLSARAERRHRDGQVPPRIAAVQINPSVAKSIKKTLKSTGHGQDDFSMDEISDRVASPMEIASDRDDATFSRDDYVEPATAASNTSVDYARAAVLTEWRPQREKGTFSISDDDEEEDNTQDSIPEDSDDELVGLVMPEDDEDSENDSQSVDDRIEAEWQKEWVEMGLLYFLR